MGLEKDMALEKKAWRWKKRAWHLERGAWRGAMLKGTWGNTNTECITDQSKWSRLFGLVVVCSLYNLVEMISLP